MAIQGKVISSDDLFGCLVCATAKQGLAEEGSSGGVRASFLGDASPATGVMVTVAAGKFKAGLARRRLRQKRTAMAQNQLARTQSHARLKAAMDKARPASPPNFVFLARTHTHSPTSNKRRNTPTSFVALI